MALLDSKMVRWLRSAKAKQEGSSLGPRFIHWEPPRIRSDDRRLLTPSDFGVADYDEKRKFDLIRGKFKG
jgi:hypothetical protein